MNDSGGNEEAAWWQLADMWRDLNSNRGRREHIDSVLTVHANYQDLWTEPQAAEMSPLYQVKVGKETGIHCWNSHVTAACEPAQTLESKQYSGVWILT